MDTRTVLPSERLAVVPDNSRRSGIFRLQFPER